MPMLSNIMELHCLLLIDRKVLIISIALSVVLVTPRTEYIVVQQEINSLTYPCCLHTHTHPLFLFLSLSLSLSLSPPSLQTPQPSSDSFPVCGDRW